jgi:hypothetical protein
MTRFVKIIALTAGLALAGVAAAQAPPSTRIRGDIVSLSGDTLRRWLARRQSGR